MTITVLVCNNGLGHLKRVLSVIIQILKLNNNINFKIYTDINKLVYFKNLVVKIPNHLIQLIHFPSNVECYESDFLTDHKNELLKADCIWSDNLSFPLKYNENCILSGSFIWANQLDKKYSNAELKLLEEYYPKMIGVKYFSSNTVKIKTDFQGVGIYKYMYRKKSYEDSKSILISCGKSQDGIFFFKNIISDIIEVVSTFDKNKDIYLEPCLYELLKNKNNFKKATYCSKMYNDIGSAVIRPGLGTVSDLWSLGIKIFPVHEPGNNEMQYNSNVICNLQGDKAVSLNIKDAIISAIDFSSNKHLKKDCEDKLNQLDFNGIEKTAELIIDNLN